MEERTSIDLGPGLKLEAWLGRADTARGGLVVCHPHPLYGGDMDNPVVVRAVEVAREAGLNTLRFNFRGAGASGGSHDKGRGEQDDVRAALRTLRECAPERPLGLAGYSFGAWMASAVAARESDLAALCLIAPPLATFNLVLPDPPPRHLLVVAGTRDSYCPPAELERFAAGLPASAVVQIDGADHFFFGKLFPLGEAIRDWTRAWV